ncbi:MAG: aminotransferase DegT, partial [Acidimicrobiaceae bacterium]|nr:aminotransferase DegT [Acidimicrobiaceae bacterium]
MSIPISRPIIGLEEEEAVLNVLRSGMIAGGAKVVEFEEAFAEFVNADHAVAVNSGTSALVVGLAACGVGPGDEVIVPSFTFAASPNAIAMVGAKPVFVDIEPRYFCLDPASVQAAITPRTRAVMPVHLYGHPAEMTTLDEMCRNRGVMIVEDASQAHGAALAGRAVGSWGNAGTFSFYATKNMTTGEGGLI